MSRETHVPMPVRVDVALTVRADDTPVIVLTPVDPLGESITLHISESTGMELVGDLAVAVRQLHRGLRQMPAPYPVQHPCRGCNRMPAEHPHGQCASWY